MNFWPLDLDLAVLVAYFVIVTFLGVVVGQKQTKNLRDFFIAGGKWGPVVAFVFVFASAVGGAEAVVVAGASYESGLSGIWYWWAGLFGIVVYYLFAPIYKRSRVFNSTEFYEMRFGPGVATIYAFLGLVITVGHVGIFALGGGKSIAGLTGLEVHHAVLISGVVVAAYVGSGGLMSSLLTDLFQGVMALTAFCFLLLPFLWKAAGGFDGLLQLPPEFWSLHSEELPPSEIFVFVFSATFGGAASPFIFSLIVVGRDERAATQCGWGHLWKRTITILFVLYGMLFLLYKPDLADPEQAWGIVMKELLPAGLLGLLVASFFAALMSTVDTQSTAATAIIVDYLFRRRLFPRRSTRFYFRSARVLSILVVFPSCAMALQFKNLQDFAKFLAPLMFLMSVPLYFGIVWRRANRQGTWVALGAGTGAYVICQALNRLVAARLDGQLPAADSPWLRFWDEYAFEMNVMVPAVVTIVGMYVVSRWTLPEANVLLNRFYGILNTPLGKEDRLKAVGVRLPAMDEGSQETGGNDLDESLDHGALAALYDSYAASKICGRDSSIETLKEPGLVWYYRGAVQLSVCCLLLIGTLWLVARVMASLSLA